MQADEAPGQRDPEEAMIEVLRVGVPRLRELMRGGDMLLHSIVASHVALDRLRDMELL